MSEVQSGLVKAMMAVRDDSGPFIKVSGSFVGNGKQWVGNVVASATAVYLLKVLQPRQGATQGAAVGGLIGALVGAAVDAARGELADVTPSTCLAQDLPDALRAALDPTGSHSAKGVIVIPKSTIRRFDYKGLGGTMTVQVGSDRFVAISGIFSKGKIRTALESMGWTLNTELHPTDAPIHDTRPEAERQSQKARSKTLRVIWYGFIALLLLALLALAVFANLR
jgi:hypothetical protein